MADPIKKLRTQADLARERQEFTRLLAAGTTGIANDIGQGIGPGDIINYVSPVAVVKLMVADVVPVLDKNYVGTLKVTLIGLPFTLEVPSGQPVKNFVMSGLKGQPPGPELLSVLTDLVNTIRMRVDVMRPPTVEEIASGNGALGAVPGENIGYAEPVPPSVPSEGDNEP